MNRLKALFKAIILASFAGFFIKLHYTNDISKFINPKYNLMSMLAACAFVIFFFVQILRIWGEQREESCSSCCGHDHHDESKLKKVVSYLIVVFPLVTGFTFAPSVLDASIAANKGTLLKPSNTPDENQSILPPGVESHTEVVPNDNYFSKKEYENRMDELSDQNKLEMKEDIFSSYYEAIETEPEKFKGREVKLEGFVFKEEGLADHQLVLSRFMITHCVADASVIGLLVQFDEAANYQEDTWLEITGTLDMTMYNGYELPVIHASDWNEKEIPEDPYVFPAVIQLVE